MDEIVNPHDKLFRETWSDLETAKSFLQHYLPQEALSLMSLDTLEICKDTFCGAATYNYSIGAIPRAIGPIPDRHPLFILTEWSDRGVGEIHSRF